MAITTLLDPTKLPNRTMDQPTFDAAMAYLMTNLPQWGTDANTLAANLNSIAAGGAYAIPYTLDTTSTADSDPGVGKMRFDQYANQSISAVFRVSTTAAGGSALSAVIDTFDDSTSTVKGHIKLVKVGDPTKFMIFSVSGLIGSGATPYRNITGAVVASSSTNPFANGDSLIMYFQRAGDKGDTGAAAVSGNMFLLATATVSSAVANIDFLNVFSSTYDNYIIEILGLVPQNNTALNLRLAKSGVVDTGANYYYAGPNVTGTNGTSFPITSAAVTTSSGFGAVTTVEIRNANDAVRHKSMTTVGTFFDNTPTANTVDYSCAYSFASAISGFRLYFGTGNITAGTVRVYGIKNT